VRQLILSPRWIMWHLLTIGAMLTCGWLAAWQWQRAGSSMGSALNVGYGLQWPVFAVFFGVMWWRMISMEIRRIRGELAEDPWDVDEPVVEHSAPLADGPSPFNARPVANAPRVDDADDPELAAYNRMLAALAERDRAET
jgi:DNA-binding transcriptional regulator of glucitol operon